MNVQGQEGWEWGVEKASQWVYCSPNTVRVNKSRRWTGHIARMEEDGSAFKILTGKPTGSLEVGWRTNNFLYYKAFVLIPYCQCRLTDKEGKKSTSVIAMRRRFFC